MQVLEALWARFESQWYHDWLGLQAEKGAGMNMSKRCDLLPILRINAVLRLPLMEQFVHPEHCTSHEEPSPVNLAVSWLASSSQV